MRHCIHYARPLIFGVVVTMAMVTAQAAPSSGTGVAFPDATRAPDQGPQGREYRAAIQALLDGNLPKAKAGFETSLKIDPQYAPALIGLADVAQAERKPVEAGQYLQRAEHAAPRSPAVYLAWGRYYIAAKQTSQAERSLLKARELDPKTLPPMVELGDLYLREGRIADALRIYREAATLDAANRFAQYGLGAAAAAAGQREEALHAFEAAARLAPKDPAPLRAAGLLYLDSGAPDKALAAFDKGLARQPKFLPLMLDRADALGRQKRWGDALTQVGQAEKLAPNSAEVQLKMADIYQGAARWSEAKARYLKTIALDPRSALAFNNLAWMTVARHGDPKQAVEWASKAVGLSPGSSPFHDTLGWALRAAGDLAGAQASLHKAITLEPKVAVYHFHLGVVQGEMKQAAAARASLQRALELDPHLPQADEARRLLNTGT